VNREEMSEVYGDEFMDEFDQEFDIAPEDMKVSFRYKLTRFLTNLLDNKLVWYAAGFIDAIIVAYALSLFLK
jgi:hypothetical protein